MKCQRQITKICWQDHIKNSGVAGLGPVSDLITRRRNSVFGHIARLSEDTPAHQALRCHVDLTLGHLISLTKAGRVAEVVPTTDGLTSYAGTTTTRHQLICEDPPHVVIRE